MDKTTSGRAPTKGSAIATTGAIIFEVVFLICHGVSAASPGLPTRSGTMPKHAQTDRGVLKRRACLRLQVRPGPGNAE